MGHPPKFQEHRYGIASMLSDMAKGNPDWDSMAQWIDSGTGEFWKGALIGAVVAVVLTSETVKESLGNIFTRLFGSKEEKK
ncbi:MAG: hypothetical protein JRI66_12815 [Deltaproteobacteria bacterium]|nr:hypothetical protein [Deltaproteobacteria bacterium]